MSKTTEGDASRELLERFAGVAVSTEKLQALVHAVAPAAAAVATPVQRMKRVGMRWRAAGADAMLALRAVYRSTGAWDRLWGQTRAP